MINTTQTIRLTNSAPVINGKQRYAVNSVSFVPADTPLKLADYFNIPGVFALRSVSDSPTGGAAYLQTSVMAADFRGYVEIVFENVEDTMQSWHIDGHNFFVVGWVYRPTALKNDYSPDRPVFASMPLDYYKKKERNSLNFHGYENLKVFVFVMCIDIGQDGRRAVDTCE